jgi:RimJ/RimL family protein N-acetyltransferase
MRALLRHPSILSRFGDDRAVTMWTERLEIRLPVESDRARFVELFCNDDFMVFSDGVLDEPAAQRRFDEMLVRAEELSFAKQPVIERSTGMTVGYSGVDWFDFEGQRWLEYGWRLVVEARGHGYATEAGRAILAHAAEVSDAEILAIIDPQNAPSQNVAGKLGFTFWKQALVDDGYLVNLSRLQLRDRRGAPPARR